MKKLLSVLLTVCIIAVSVSAGFVVSFAAGTKIDGTDVTWSYNSETKVLTIGGEGAIPDYNEYKDASGNVTLKYPWKNLAYTSVVFGSKVTGIGNYAFCYSKSLEKVTIPETIAVLGKGVFLNCTTLTDVTIKTTATAIKTNTFAGCTALKNVTIAEGPKTIESKAFYGCTALEAISVPSGVTTIGTEAFYSCIGLKSVVISDTVKSIGNYAFYCCEALTSLTLGKKLQKIGESAFDSCIALTSVEIPDSVTTISAGAFSGCSLLANVTLPAGLTEIGENAFNLCPLLKGVEIPAYFTTIGTKAFGYGKRGAKVEGFTVTGYEESSAKTYATENGFNFVSLGNYYNGDCGENAKWTFDHEKGVLTISGTGAMKDYKSVSDPAPYKRFASDIKEIVIGDGITEIGNYAFYNMGPDEITIPATVTAIGTKAIGKYSNGVLKEGYVISGYVGTDAERYASEMGITFTDLAPYNGSCGENATWSFDKETKTLTISGTGAMADFGQNTLTEYRKYNYGIQKIVVEDGITYIGKYAFVLNNTVEEIRFPESVESMGNYPFAYIRTVVDDENKLARDTALKVYGFNATPVKAYAETLELEYISLDPKEIPDFELDASLPAKLDKENNVIYLYATEFKAADFLAVFPKEQYTNVTISTEVIGTGSVLQLEVEGTTKDITFVVVGDTNGDGFVNSMDALDILNHSVETAMLEGVALKAGDISGDGVINSNDALITLQISIGEIEIGSLMEGTTEPDTDSDTEPEEGTETDVIPA